MMTDDDMSFITIIYLLHFFPVFLHAYCQQYFLRHRLVVIRM
jgi:hypothetical protein